MKRQRLFDIELRKSVRKELERREKIKRGIQKRILEEARLKRAMNKIPGVIEFLSSDKKFAKYFSKAEQLRGFGEQNSFPTFSGHAPKKNSAVELAAHSFCERRLSRMLQRETDVEITYYIALVSSWGAKRVVVCECVYRSAAYEWVERDPSERPAIRNMLLKLANPRSALQVLFAHRPPK